MLAGVSQAQSILTVYQVYGMSASRMVTPAGTPEITFGLAFVPARIL